MTEQANPVAEHEAFPAPPYALTLRLVQITSFIIFSNRAIKGASGSFDEMRAFYRKVLIHNLLLGWWGFPFGLVWTPMALASNRKAMAKLRELNEAGSAPGGWYDDPSGHHAVRFWDGSDWTDKVSDVSTDALPAA